jgi:hypothetical protein
MKPKLLLASVALAAAASIQAPASADEALTGDTRLACEAILCLSTGTRPGECSPSLHRYFSISHRKLSDTIRARGNFLKLCPVANQTPEMSLLVNAMANGAGRCDAAFAERHASFMGNWGQRDGAHRQPDARLLRGLYRPRLHRLFRHAAALRGDARKGRVLGRSQ